MRALVVSDIRFFREGIARALNEDGIDAELSDHARPRISEIVAGADVVLVDLVSDQLSATLELAGHTKPIVGMAMTADPPVVAAAALGVRAFVGCDQTLATLVRTVRRAVRGDAVCPDSIAAVLFSRLNTTEVAVTPVPIEALTRREREIGHLVMRGLSNKEIATALVIEPATVKNHVHQLLRKLDVRRRGQAADVLRAVWTETSSHLAPTVQPSAPSP